MSPIIKYTQRGNTVLGLLIIAAIVWGFSSIFRKDESSYNGDYVQPHTRADSLIDTSYTNDGQNGHDYEESPGANFTGNAYGEISYSNGGQQDLYIYGDCEEGGYCYGENDNGDEVEIYVYDLGDGYGYGEDEFGNEIEFNY